MNPFTAASNSTPMRQQLYRQVYSAMPSPTRTISSPIQFQQYQQHTYAHHSASLSPTHTPYAHHSASPSPTHTPYAHHSASPSPTDAPLLTQQQQTDTQYSSTPSPTNLTTESSTVVKLSIPENLEATYLDI